MTKKQIEQLRNIKLTYKKAGQFLHCKHCLGKYLKERDKNGGISPASPRDTFHYELSSYVIDMPNKQKVGIVVVWCKTCGRPVWDSRHLTHLY